MREIALDTETTGLDPKRGDRLVEIGCVELHHFVPTGRTFHCYINPERDMPEGAFKVHGLSAEFLSKHPVFSEKASEFLEFIGTSTLVIHNANFDMGFINAELSRINMSTISMDRVVDTVKMARAKFPGAPANLDALCRRFNIDNTKRDLHGALIDAHLLAQCYLELRGGKQPGLSFGGKAESAVVKQEATTHTTRPVRPARPFLVSDEEKAQHLELLKKVGQEVW